MNVTFWNFPPTLVVTNDKNNVSRAPRSDMKTKKSLFGEVFKYRLWKYLREINPELRLNLARDKILS
jgi:hypothetical protein